MKYANDQISTMGFGVFHANYTLVMEIKAGKSEQLSFEH